MMSGPPPLKMGAGTAAPHEDPSIVARLADGDMDAAAELYDRFAAQLFGLARRIVRNDGDAEEVVQDVFAQAWRTAGAFQSSRGSVGAWLLMMTRSRAIDRLRAREARPDLAADAYTDSSDARSVLPADQVVADEEAAQVRAALAGLAGPQREALELAYFEGLSQSEIAARLTQPLGTIKTRMRTALQTLRERLRS